MKGVRESDRETVPAARRASRQHRSEKPKRTREAKCMGECPPLTGNESRRGHMPLCCLRPQHPSLPCVAWLSLAPFDRSEMKSATPASSSSHMSGAPHPPPLAPRFRAQQEPWDFSSHLMRHSSIYTTDTEQVRGRWVREQQPGLLGGTEGLPGPPRRPRHAPRMQGKPVLASNKLKEICVYEHV